MAKRTNEWVLKTAGVPRSLLESVKEMKLAYYGHILRKKRGLPGEGINTRYNPRLPYSR